MSKTLDEKSRFIELRAKGYSFQKISDEINVSKPTLIGWAKDIDTIMAVSEQQKIYLEDLKSEHLIGKVHRINTLGSILSRSISELNSRDFSEISSPKLVEIICKLQIQLSEECPEESSDQDYTKTEEFRHREIMRMLDEFFNKQP